MFMITTVKTVRNITATATPSVVCRARNRRKNERKYDDDDDDDDQYYNHNYRIFQSNVSKTQITLSDVKDAIDCCSTILDDRMKCSCYQQFGVDGKMAEKYYKKVEGMERQYHIEAIDEPYISISISRSEKKDNRKATKKPIRKWFMFEAINDNDNDNDNDDNDNNDREQY